MKTPVLQTPVLILGSGAAGLSVALHLRGRPAILLSKTGFARGGSTILAQGGIAAAIGAEDSAALHSRDTILAGAGLSRRESVESVTEEAPRRIRELLDLGAAFDRDARGNLSLGREGAHSRRRILHAHGDATGAEIARTMGRALASRPGIRLLEHVFAVDLEVDRGRVTGVRAVDEDGRPLLILAGATVLATGGIGQLWLRSSNPVEATGDGLAMALRAGAATAGLEFMQFHPTGLLRSGPGPLPLLTEALRGEGARVVDENGSPFLEGIDPRAELAPRDIVARAIFRKQMEGHEIRLDLSSLAARMSEEFPTVLKFCTEAGLDPGHDLLPITPLAHYHMGGIVTDSLGRTSLQGLFACGEVASTGLHGANRLASNSLLEGLVYGARIGEFLSKTPLELPAATQTFSAQPEIRRLSSEDPGLMHRLRELMWRDVGILRRESGLRRALDEIRSLRRRNSRRGELSNMLDVAACITRAALRRRESRGSHFRTDFPRTSPAWRRDLICRNGHIEGPGIKTRRAAH